MGSSEKWAKAPPCTWSPIPPPELQGEPLEDLTTNGGFVSFGILLPYPEYKPGIAWFKYITINITKNYH